MFPFKVAFCSLAKMWRECAISKVETMAVLCAAMERFGGVIDADFQI